MAKKRSESSAQGKPRKKSAKHTPDSQIDFGDISELTDEQLEGARRVGRPKSDNPKQLIAVRLSPQLLSDLKKLAKHRKTPYQTLMHDLLEKAVKDVA
ncbi:BrnA antitoxin family protein [Oligoflexia bacterium]|nr:BrnA antitoxin family protein [Oligoflexia bacterium]